MREIDLREVFSILLRKIFIIILVTLITGGAAFAVTHYCITPLYTASIKLYVNNTTEKDNTSITSGDVTASQSLVDTYITMIKSASVIDEVISHTGVKYSTEGLISLITAGALNSTEVFEVSVSSPDPKEATLIANQIAETSTDFLAKIVVGSSIKIVDYAKVPTTPSSPSYTKNVAIGLLLGFVLSCGVCLLVALFDTRIKSADDLAAISELPILGSVSDFHDSGKGKYDYDYYTK